MGCGSSSSGTVDSNNNKKKVRDAGPELTQEPDTEDIDVPASEPGYPSPKPPPNKKNDIFVVSKMKKVDENARNAPAEKSKDYADLISYLKLNCKTDVEILRAIFMWIGTQPIETAEYAGVSDSNTPLGFMKLMKENRASYSSFFALLCRKAGLPCVIIKGYAKSVGYEVGDDQDAVKTLRNSWNAVYVAGGWRIVFPLWACTAVSGYSSGMYTKVESKGQAVREKEEQSRGKDIKQLNEYYFLTDPEEFIFIACPNEPRWQLLPQQWTLHKFAEVPYCRQGYFREKVNIMSKLSCRLYAVEGKCDVELGCDDTTDMGFDYELYYNNKESERSISSSLQLNNFVMMNRSSSKWVFMIRFPEVGVYKLQIVGGRRGHEQQMCAFKVYVNEVRDDVQPFPINPGAIGYGPNADTEQAGLKAISHETAVVKVFRRQQVTFNFKLTRNIHIRTELVHESMSKEELSKCVKTTQKDKKLNVQVSVPDNGEYALAMHAQQDGRGEYKNVCNYLLTSEQNKKKRLREWETPMEKKTRSSVQNMTKSKGTRDIDDLEQQLSRFEKLDIEDKGDLAAGYDALDYKKIKKELEDAIKRRHLATLDKAIEHGHESRFKEQVTKQINEAEEVRDHLRHLNRIAHDILEMKQATISEIRSYKYPPRIIEDIMRSTFLMLGEKEIWIETWEDVQVLMGKTGKDGMLRRVRQFDTVTVKPESRRHADSTLGSHTETEARIASAGAGTFYVWLRNVTETLDQQNKQEEAEQSEIATEQELDVDKQNKSTRKKK